MGDELVGRDGDNGPEHPQVHFKCLAYSVTESAGSIDIIVQKVQSKSEFSFGIRTASDTAHESSEFEPIDKILTFQAKQTEMIIPIRIFDND